MKTWNDIKIGDHIYCLIGHRHHYLEIRRCKVTRIKNLTNEYIKIWYTHPLNRNDDFLKLEERSLFISKNQYTDDKDWKTKKYKYLVITEFNEEIIEEFEKIHGI